MKRSKLLISVLVVGLLLTFMFTAVMADFNPPEGAQTQIPQDGSLLIPYQRGQRHDVSAYTVQPNDDVIAPDEVMPDGVPLSPVNQWVFTKTPKFWFIKTPGATAYKIELRNFLSDDLVYTFTGPANCTDIPGICWLQPSTKLKTYEYFNWDNGDYLWRVGSKVGGIWSYSGYYGFAVLSKGFNSTFNVDMKKWYPIDGDWFQYAPGYLKSNGIPYSYSSSMQKEYFLSDYVYEVRMKGKTGDQLQGIIMGGIPDPIRPGGTWYDGVYFLNANGFTGILIIQDNVQVTWTGWVYAPYVNPTGWNTLQLVVDAPDAYLMINGYPDWSIFGATYYIEPGYVGLVHEKDTMASAQLLVDWAKLNYVPQPMLLDLTANMDGAKVLDLTNLPAGASQSSSPFDPPE